MITPENKTESAEVSPQRRSNIEELCCQHREAIQFCATFYKWCHWLDDVIDGDKVWNVDDTVRVNLSVAVVFSENAFFLRHRAALMPLIMQAARAQADAVEWSQREDLQDRRAAEVLKSFYHEVIWHAAFLAAVEKGRDGWEHLTAMTRKYRAFDYDFKD